MIEQVIKILVKEVGKVPETKIIKNDIQEFYKIVGGCFEMVRVPLIEDMLYMVCNDIGKLVNLPVNFYEPARSDIIVGNVFFTAGDYEGNSISLTNEQIEQLKSYLNSQTLW